MEFVLLIVVIVIVAVGFTARSAVHTQHYFLPEDEILRSVDAMHQYGHDQEAICLLQEYAEHYPQSEPLREKLRQYEVFNQQHRRAH